MPATSPHSYAPGGSAVLEQGHPEGAAEAEAVNLGPEEGGENTIERSSLGDGGQRDITSSSSSSPASSTKQLQPPEQPTQVLPSSKTSSQAAS